MRTLLFSVTRKDLIIDFFRAGGKGGQHQNKTSSACRIRHKSSGAVGESREDRRQHINRKIAFNRMANSKQFQNWAKMQAAAVLEGHRNTEDKVNKSMVSSNLKTEYITTYICDGCNKKETITSAEQGVLPEWVEMVEGDTHYCSTCAGRDDA